MEEVIMTQVSISHIPEYIKQGIEKKTVEAHYEVSTGGEEKKEFTDLGEAREEASKRMNSLVEKVCVRYWEFF